MFDCANGARWVVDANMIVDLDKGPAVVMVTACDSHLLRRKGVAA